MVALFFKLLSASHSVPKCRLGPGLLVEGRKHSVLTYYWKIFSLKTIPSIFFTFCCFSHVIWRIIIRDFLLDKNNSIELIIHDQETHLWFGHIAVQSWLNSNIWGKSCSLSLACFRQRLCPRDATQEMISIDQNNLISYKTIFTPFECLVATLHILVKKSNCLVSAGFK